MNPEQIGRVGLFLFAACGFLATAGASLGMVLLTGAFLAVCVRQRRLALNEPVILVALLFCAYILLCAAVAYMVRPQFGPQLWEAATDWLKILLFVPVAYFIGSDPGRMRHVLLLALTGLVAGMLWRMDWGLILKDPLAFLYTRDPFSFTALATALYSGTGLLGLILMRRWLWGEGQASRPAYLVRLTLWSGAAALLALALVQSMSRGSWVAWAPALLVGLVLAGQARAPLRALVRRPLLLLGALAALGLVAMHSPDLTSRIASDLAWASGKQQVSAGSSLGLRWSAQQAGFAFWCEHPWMGWGPGLSESLMEQSGNQDLVDGTDSVLVHLHNTYLEVLVQFGAVGFLLLGLLVWLLMRGLIRVRGATPPDRDLRAFLLAAFVYLLLWSLTNYRVVHQDWLVFWALLAGVAAAWAPGRGWSNRDPCVM